MCSCGLAIAQLSSHSQQQLVTVPGPIGVQLQMQELQLEVKDLQLSRAADHEIQVKDHEFLMGAKGSLDTIKWLIGIALVPLAILVIQNFRLKPKP
jgi:hypothetical protein